MVRFAPAPYPQHGVPRHPEWRARRARTDGTRTPWDRSADAAGRTRGSAGSDRAAARGERRLRHRDVQNGSDRTCRRGCRAGATRSSVVAKPCRRDQVDPFVRCLGLWGLCLGGCLPGRHDPTPHRLQQFVESVTRDGRDLHEGQLLLPHVTTQRVETLGIVQRIDLGCDDNLRLGGDALVEAAQLVAYRVEVLYRITTRGTGNIDQMHEHFRALDMPQELMAEAMAFVRAPDQSGHVGDDEAAIAAE